MHMQHKTNQIDELTPFVQTHIEPIFAPSGPVRAPLAPNLLLRCAPCEVGACARPFELRHLSCFRGSGPFRTSFPQSGLTSLILLRPSFPLSSFLLPGSGSAQKKTARRRPFFFGTNSCRLFPALRPSDGSAFYTRSMSCGNTDCGSGCAPGCASGSFRQTACHSEATSTKFCTHCATFEPSSMRMDITP